VSLCKTGVCIRVMRQRILNIGQFLLSRIGGDAHPVSHGGGVWMFRERAVFNFRSRSLQSIRTEPSLLTVTSKHTLIRSFFQKLPNTGEGIDLCQ
jgi:hypothetical protein